MINAKNYSLTVTFLEPILGSQPSKDVASEFIAKRNGYELPQDEEDALPEALERGTTVFHRWQGTPCLVDYQVKGFLKETGRVMVTRVTDGEKVKALRSKVDQFVFVEPRWLRLETHNGDEICYNERPLRAQTAQGERVALARSEELPAGTSFKCHLTVLAPDIITEDMLRSILDYGYYKGLGQWRGGGYGRFRYELEEEKC
jgi:hypothetical protein